MSEIAASFRPICASKFRLIRRIVIPICRRCAVKLNLKNSVNQELLVNPQLIVEILSESTAEFDRGYKFTYYKSIESFTEYVLIAQDRPHVSQFVKQGENDWLNHEFNDIEDRFHLASLDCELELSELYEGVKFPETDSRNRFESISE